MLTKPISKTCGLLALLLLAGCFTVPFEEPEMAPLAADVNPATLPVRFADRLPAQFETENTLVFQVFWKEIAALGYAKVDREAETFEVLCLNHLGVQLFHLSGDTDGNHLRYAIPEFKKHPEFVDAVGSDIRYVYFNLIPDADAAAEVKEDRVIYRETSEGRQVTEFMFGGSQLALLEKKTVNGRKTDRTARFYEYEERTGGNTLFPGGIVLHNPAQNYRLVIKTRGVTLE